MGLDYRLDQAYVDAKLLDILENKYGPQHTIDVLKECIKVLQPYAKKQEEITHV